jgi:two-component system, NtrC family, sensor histidine kinase GlrK
MRFGRPKSLSGLLLIGFALVAIPLLVAVVNATVQMRRLTQQSETLVRRGVEATRHAQELFQQTTALERTARLYAVLGDEKLKDVFNQHHLSFNRSLAALDRIKPEPSTRELIASVRADGASLATALETNPTGSPALAKAIEEFTRVPDAVAALGQTTSTDINTQLGELQVIAADTQRQLFWQATALVPITVVIVFVFVSLLARPIRQIDQAINALGRGAFSRPVIVQGPTDLERLGRQLEWLRSRLLDLAQEKNRFLRHISHELKTPLANIREGTELLMEGAVGPLDPNQREVAGILRENGIKLQRLIENLLSFSAWQAKTVGLELSQFPLRQLVTTVVGAQQLTLVAHRIKLDVKVQDIEITADRGKLRLILDNLLSNAVKFTPRDGTIFIHALTFKENLTIDLADTGPGIPADERAQVFDAFYTGKTEQAGHVRGTGIGLSVVMEFVQAHGGTIELVEGVHPGAHFRIRLPVRPADRRSSPEAGEAA